MLREHCRDWAFQLERGQGGYEHWQLRFRLSQKMRMATLISKRWFGTGHLSPTSNTVAGNRDFDYVMKEEGRIEGPWSSKDPEEEVPLPLPGRLQAFRSHALRSWQEEVLSIMENPQERIIHVISDTEGNSGKSTFCQNEVAKGNAVKLPPISTTKDMMQAVCGIVKQLLKAGKQPKCFFIDIPRAMSWSRAEECNFYAAIESLKDGEAYDTRYSYQSIVFETPEIFIFTNMVPKKHLLSVDRWRYYRIVKSEDDYDLEESEL